MCVQATSSAAPCDAAPWRFSLYADAVTNRVAGHRVSHSVSNASVLACVWQGQNAVIKLVQPLVVRNPADVQPLQTLMANEVRLYTGRLATLQGAAFPASSETQ
jgi:hypothetical protein